jgi:DNA-binding transcriptional MerR regulator
MDVAQREWISLKEASKQVGIPMTTIRGWARQGMIETKESSTGRLVDVEQVREKAMGRVPIKRPSDLQDRVADGTPERAAGRPTREKELAGTLLELQALARERMELE